ncbi:hypothetical protein K461DRAFT_228465 [Myriangium duriaei CBS 260.36]|uniref:OPA3-like protein n=1 Tax=Myriangium duriaei CBS 260.36 TaxID=1168546 RepID=A0A9P4MKU3_9PEZI|nr:hypothetical protein K461DRAFT_228465 [Myriangium duriaei CBS 260.36]
MSLTLKLASLAIRTLAKPVGNSIKARAREHDGFRRLFIKFAQGLHRVDMRMRLGILHDAAAQERMHAREAAEQAAAVAKKRLEAATPTVRTEAAQVKFDAEVQKAKESAGGEGAKKEPPKEEKKKPKIRPLTDARAIELGANFASETFIFMVAAGLLVFERWWSKRKEAVKDEHVVERLRSLEEQTERVSHLEREIRRLRGETVPEPPSKAKEEDPTLVKEGEKEVQVVAAS